MGKTGRPRKDTEERLTWLRKLLPGLRDGSISKAEAARELGISHRSLGRYLTRMEEAGDIPSASTFQPVADIQSILDVTEMMRRDYGIAYDDVEQQAILEAISTSQGR